MDPPPFPPFPTTTTTTTATAQLNHSDSVESSPRSHSTSTWDEPLPPVPGAKLRLMCSYGGHIIPRPHNKSLCYVGGDTRMVVVDRHSSLSDLSSRLSRTLLNGRPFTLKYQLPNEDLDSLISVTTDEDLDNMIEEYDRTTSNSPLKSRLRLFLFVAKPETATSMGSLLDDAKSETWFVDALNSTGLLPRGLSDSAAIDRLLGLDGVDAVVSNSDLESQADHSVGGNKEVAKNGHDVHSVPDSSTVETASSFGSSSSSPSMSNLPPLRVRVTEGGVKVLDHKVGLEERFAQLTVDLPMQKQDDGFINALSTSPPLPPLPTAVAASVVNSMAVSGENPSRVFSDDERSEQGAPVGLRKPPLPLQPVQLKAGVGYNLPSPDSVASDSSIASATSSSKAMIYQDPVHVTSRDNRAPANAGDPKTDISDLSSRIQMHQVQESGYVLPPQLDQQQQFIHTSTHYIHHPATGPVPVSSYYSMYGPPAQQQLHYQMDQQFPTYLLPITQNLPYNLAMQSNIADATSAASSRPQTPPNPALVSHAAAYKETLPPIYPTKTATSGAIPEMAAASVYQTVTTANQTLVQVPSNQFQQQYLGFSQMHHPSQSIAPASVAAANYAFEYAHPAHDQVYYTQHPAATLPPQYQTLTPAAAVVLSEASTQLPTDNVKQQIRPSQPL
ncbi:hypothetical protein L1049_028584 [Liquidambar formosana]|uniref:PB1 domain-containing protein n=1 Tax=Liquidambar formosana TaxID=63359 RepID=A0AAP0RKQ6_LIQFO